MGIEIKLTDREFPISPYFVDFLYQHINSNTYSSDWFDQVKEGGSKQPGEEANRARSEQVISALAGNAVANQAVGRSYDLFLSLLLGRVDRLDALHARYKFIFIVGAPRSGGSYLTKQIYTALGMTPAHVPRVIAHDGFPDLSPFSLVDRFNQSTMMTQRMGEYLTMVELYFSAAKSRGNRIIVPKKAYDAVYHGAFINRIAGPEAEYWVSIRHPVTACISTYERAGRELQNDENFQKKSGQEIVMERDYRLTSGATEAEVLARPYFDVYLRYWEQYHYNLALTGLGANKNWTIIPYTEQAMGKMAADISDRFGHNEPVEPFKVFDKRDRHPEWYARAEKSILRVRDIWAAMGLVFPLDEVMESW